MTISRADNILNFFYKGKAKPVSLKNSDAQILDNAGLNWHAVKQSCLVQKPSGEIKKSNIADTVLRSDTGEEIAVVSKNWSIYQNHELLQDIRQFCRYSGYDLDAGGTIESRTGGFGRYLIPFFSIKINEISNLVERKVGDEIQQYLIVGSPIAQNQAIFIELVSLRLTCLNGATVPVKLSGVKLSHTKANTEKGLEENLRLVRNGYKSYLQELELLADTPLTEEAALVILSKLFGDTKKTWEQQPRMVKQTFDIYTGEYDSMLSEHGIDLGQSSLQCFNTCYGLYNAVTAYNSHFRGNFNTTSNSALFSSWRGAISKENKKAFSEISAWGKKVRERTQKISLA